MISAGNHGSQLPREIQAAKTVPMPSTEQPPVPLKAPAMMPVHTLTTQMPASLESAQHTSSTSSANALTLHKELLAAAHSSNLKDKAFPCNTTIPTPSTATITAATAAATVSSKQIAREGTSTSYDKLTVPQPFWEVELASSFPGLSNGEWYDAKEGSPPDEVYWAGSNDDVPMYTVNQAIEHIGAKCEGHWAGSVQNTYQNFKYINRHT